MGCIWSRSGLPKYFDNNIPPYPASPFKLSGVETGYAETSLVQKSSSTEEDTQLQAAPHSEVLGVQPSAELAEPRAVLYGFSSSDTSKV